jgi:23S rRNA (uracil1939-C5)-methyltransferase
MAMAIPSHAPIDVPDDARRDHVHEEVAGRRWRISGRSFFQARPDGADALAATVADAAAAVGSPSNAVDLYSGVGLFAGVLADAGWTVTAVEGSAAAVADARVNLAGTDVDVVAADVLQWSPPAAALVVADPSRAGLGSQGVAVVTATGATRAVLVSCDPAALGRDAGLLHRAGYRLTSVTPVDLFPHTFHVETVSVFDRRVSS